MFRILIFTVFSGLAASSWAQPMEYRCRNAIVIRDGDLIRILGRITSRETVEYINTNVMIRPHINNDDSMEFTVYVDKLWRYEATHCRRVR